MPVDTYASKPRRFALRLTCAGHRRRSMPASSTGRTHHIFFCLLGVGVGIGIGIEFGVPQIFG
jgi:hypothetical protein